MQGNIANTYDILGRHEEALRMEREVYSGRLKLNGEEHEQTLVAANNYAASLIGLQRFKEVKAIMRKTITAARRVLGDSHEFTLGMRRLYATALYRDPGATLDDLHEAVTTLEEIERTAQRVLGVGHPLTVTIDQDLRTSRAGLRTLGPPPPGPSVEQTFARDWLDGPG